MGPHWTVYVLNCTNGVGVLKWSGVVCDESVLVTGLGYSYRYRARYGPGQTVLALAHHVKDGCWWWLDWTGASLRMSGGDVTMTSLYLPTLPRHLLKPQYQLSLFYSISTGL